MFRLLNCKIKEDETAIVLDDEIEDDHCPMSEHLQEQLRDFCDMLVDKLSIVKKTNNEIELENSNDEQNSWVDNLAQFVISVPPAQKADNFSDKKKGTENFRHK